MSLTDRHPRTMKIPLTPPFTKGDNYSSLWQREVGRDLKKLFSRLCSCWQRKSYLTNLFPLTTIVPDVMEFRRFLKYFIKKLMVSPILESTRFKPIFPRVVHPVECLTVISNPNHKRISSAPGYLKNLKTLSFKKRSWIS